MPLLKKHARPLLALGILLALLGIVLSTFSQETTSLSSLLTQPHSFTPDLLALVAAISWGLYSNLVRRWGDQQDQGGVPIFLLLSGVVLGMIRLFTPEQSHWSFSTLGGLLYMACCPGMIAYVLWDHAMRKGKVILLASLSYLTPILSTICSILVLQIPAGPILWLGVVLVFLGAYLCKQSVTDPPAMKRSTLNSLQRYKPPVECKRTF